HREADDQGLLQAGALGDLGGVVGQGMHREAPGPRRIGGPTVTAVMHERDPTPLGETRDDLAKGPTAAADAVEHEDRWILGGLAGGMDLDEDLRAVGPVEL